MPKPLLLGTTQYTEKGPWQHRVAKGLFLLSAGWNVLCYKRNETRTKNKLESFGQTTGEENRYCSATKPRIKSRILAQSPLCVPK